MIIAFSGKLFTGKTSLAKETCELLGIFSHHSRVARIPKYHSFGDVVREGSSNRYGFDKALTTTQEGKLTMLSCGLTVREAMQEYGRDMRAKDPDFILNSVRHDFENRFDPRLFIIDDLRMPEEHDWVRSVPGSVIIRMEPNDDWVPGPYSNDRTETALDDCTDWDLRLSLPYVLADGSFVSLIGHAMAVAGVSYAKMADILSYAERHKEKPTFSDNNKGFPLSIPFDMAMSTMTASLNDLVRESESEETRPATPRP